MANLGHRLGEAKKFGVENTVTRFVANLGYQSLDDFRYWEFDVNETKCGNLIVFHDRDFKEYNDKRNVRDMSLHEIRDTYPFINSLPELITAFADNEITKPIRLEIKRLVTDVGRHGVLDAVGILRKCAHPDVQCMSFRSHFKKSFPGDSQDRFRALFKRDNVVVMNVKKKKNNLFDGSSFWSDWL